WRSLRTTNKDEAKALSAQWHARTQRVFATLKLKGESMTAPEIERLIARWMESTLDEAEDFRATCGPVSDDRREGIHLAMSNEFDTVADALLSCNYVKVEKEADELLKTASLPHLDHDSADFGRLCRRLLRAKQDVLRIEADRWNGEYTSHQPAVVASPPSPATPPVKPSPLFSEVVKKFMAETPRADRTAKPLQAELLKFLNTIGGDRPIMDITKADGRHYKEHLLNERKLSMRTVSSRLSVIGMIFKWAEQQGFVTDGVNPIKGLAPSKKIVRKTSGKRRPFTDAELLTVLSSNGFLSQRTARPERYWLVLLCLFQVCRREEAGQLAVADIQEEGGIHFLRINDDAALGQVLKNEGSRRRVPIHSALVTLGFLDFVQRIRNAGHVRLFHTLTKTHNGYSDPVGKFFGRLVTKKGIADPAVVLHSLRHGGITKLHAAGVPHNVVEILAGHAAQSVHGQTYVHRDQLPLSLLRDGLEKLRYEDVVKALTATA
ncbi:MAG: tyrosine-type recombinase/integrase, partial [Nitrospirota bacterium]|nr:tyrosine-type recombinase/integrase [Nitrospirota bacterium]